MVLDPFMGSGTTGRVCDELGRSFLGYDLKG
ncbi:MAG: DNA methyltransferase, partial [Flavobacteriaceae bacterium]